MNRGSKVDALVLGLTQVASMRPRFMNRGSSTRAANGARTRASFNEAPIHESGKWEWRISALS